MNGTRWRAVAAALSGIVTVLLGLSTNLAASLVPGAWTERNWHLVIAATVILGALTMWLGVALVRANRPDELQDDGRAQEAAVVAGASAQGHTGFLVKEVSGTVIIAEAGAHVEFSDVEHTGTLPAVSGSDGGQDDGGSRVVVGEIPARPLAFQSRLQTAQLLSDGLPTVTVLVGGPGVGKTQTAAEIARHMIEDGPSLVAWVNAEDEDHLLSGLAEVAVRLGVADPEGDSQKSANRLRDELSSRDLDGLLVLDNATDPALVRRYLPTCGQTRVLVTSQDRAVGRLGEAVTVEAFDRAESLTYLAARTQLDDASDAAKVAAELGDLPLALAQAATAVVLRGLSMSEYLQRLRASSLEELLPPDRGDAYSNSVGSAVRLAVASALAVSPVPTGAWVLDAVSLLSRQGVHRRVLLRMAVTWEVPRSEIEMAIERMVEASVLVPSADRLSVTLHRVVSRIRRDELAAHDRAFEAIERTALGLLPSLIPRSDAWRLRHDSAEIVGQALALWDTASDLELYLGPDRPDLRATRTAAGLAAWAVSHLTLTADLSRARNVGAEYLSRCRAVFGPDHPQTLEAQYVLALALEESGDYRGAVALLEDDLARRRRMGIGQTPAGLEAANRLAVACRSAGDVQRAVQLHRETLSQIEAAGSPHFPHDLHVAKGNLARSYQVAGEVQKAMPLFEASYAGCADVLGPDDPVTLTTLNNLAAAVEELGDSARALELYRDSFDRHRKVLGPDHPETLIAMNNMAVALQRVGRPKAALRLFQETLDARRRVLGPEHHNTLFARGEVAWALYKAGEYKQSIQAFEDLVPDSERLLGEDHPSTLHVTNDLAYVLQEAGELEPAFRLHAAVCSRQQQLFGEHHLRTLRTKQDLSQVLLRRGDAVDALGLAREVLAAREGIHGSDHPATLTAMHGVGRALRALQRWDEARSVLRRTYELRSRVLGPDALAVQDTRLELGGVLRRVGDEGAAQELISEAYVRRRRILGPDHPKTLEAGRALSGK